MSYVSDSELKHLLAELRTRYNAIEHVLTARAPQSKTDGSGRGYWAEPEKVRILLSSATERKLAVDDFSAILRRIAAIK